MELKGKRIAFLGDSITMGKGTSCEENRFTNVLVRLAEMGESYNYGIGGTKIARQRVIHTEKPHWDVNPFCDRYSVMEDDVDIVIVFGGTNDYGNGDAPFGTFEDRSKETYCGALHCLMQGLIEKYPAAQIVFLTPLHRANDTKKNASNNLPLKAYVDKIKETAELYSIPVLDLFATAGICPDISVHRQLYTVDGLHLNDAGAEKIARRIKAFLESL